jgi:hypothetical protein
LPKICSDSIEDMINLIFDELGYKMYKTDGINVNKDYVLNNFPWHTSCDVILKP